MRQKLKMNKRGEEEELLMKETINIIIAVLCVGALVALIVIVYFAVTRNENAKQAEAIVIGEHGIAAEIARVNSWSISNQSFLIPNPSGWFIFSFTEGTKKPDQCLGKNCVCICEDVAYVFDWGKRLAKKCDDKGACAIVDNLGSFDKIKIERGGIFISIYYNSNDLIWIIKND